LLSRASRRQTARGPGLEPARCFAGARWLLDARDDHVARPCGADHRCTDAPIVGALAGGELVKVLEQVVPVQRVTSHTPAALVSSVVALCRSLWVPDYLPPMDRRVNWKPWSLQDALGLRTSTSRRPISNGVDAPRSGWSACLLL
jgi:hypothetical protein